ncbi:MAG: NADP-dependent oxidoreductase [Anaerolineae bacterium]|nr:NADP-dependent oxidoreductase [Anaerolineae bacterium]
MKAVHVRQWGGLDAAAIEDTPLPQPGVGEILIRVRATSINPLDWKIREGYLQEFLTVPLMLGSDIAGDVEALGEGVTGFQIGTPIYGMKGLRGGGYAEFTTILPNEIAPKPKTLSYAQAAAVPHTALTAWHSLFEAANLQKGQRVLIHAAAGGVGHFAVQFAKNVGAYVIGTASESNEAFLRELGVDEYVNYQTTPFESVVKDVDVVLDGVGFDTSVRSVQVLKPGGTLVCIVTPPPMEAAAERQIHAKYAGTQPTTEVLTKIAELIDAGIVKPHIQQAFPFSKIHEAMQQNQTQHTRGKIVVTVGEQDLA